MRKINYSMQFIIVIYDFLLVKSYITISKIDSYVGSIVYYIIP